MYLHPESCKNDAGNTLSITTSYKKQWKTYSSVLSFIIIYVFEKNCHVKVLSSTFNIYYESKNKDNIKIKYDNSCISILSIYFSDSHS